VALPTLIGGAPAVLHFYNPSFTFPITFTRCFVLAFYSFDEKACIMWVKFIFLVAKKTKTSNAKMLMKVLDSCGN
jgi:hypothetical protein